MVLSLHIISLTLTSSSLQCRLVLIVVILLYLSLDPILCRYLICSLLFLYIYQQALFRPRHVAHTYADMPCASPL